MRDRFSKMTIVIAAAAVSGVLSVSVTRTSAQAPAGSGTAPMPSSALKTPWGEPDLQGIWTDETDTPLQRPARYANQEFFTEARRAEIDRARSELLSRERRAERGTERDVSGSYNNVFVSFKRTGARTSLIVDPLDGRIPPLTLRRLLPRSGSFVSPCCNRPRPARTRSRPAAEGNMIQRARRDLPNFRLATPPRA